MIKRVKLFSEKRGQLTILIIIAIVMVFAIIIYFYSSSPEFFGETTQGLDFESCVNDAVTQSVDELSLIGATKNPDFFYLYQDQQIPYYCYTNLPYETCVVQRPILKTYFEQQLKNDVQGKVQLCYEENVNNLRDSGYNVTSGKVDLNLTIIPDKITVEVSAPTTVGRQRFTEFRMYSSSKIYDILLVATSILQYEASYGDAPTQELNYFYQDLIITKLKQSDSTTLYIIEDKDSETKFQFASKSLIWPAGYDIVE